MHDFVRYTKLFADGEAYISTRKLHVSHQGTEISGAPIQRFAQYEAIGITPIEAYLQREKLQEYMLLGTPEFLRQVLPPDEDRQCITRFNRSYEFLSNFFPVQINYKGRSYPCLESAFQSAKCIREEDRESFETYTAAAAKKAGRKVDCRSDWDSIRENVMLSLLRIKFMDNMRMGEKLLATGNAELVEGNTWHDQFWGDCTCPKCRETPGLNKLGRLLMQVRTELLERACGTAVPISDDCALVARQAGASGIQIVMQYTDGSERLLCTLLHREQDHNVEVDVYDDTSLLFRACLPEGRLAGNE